MSSRLNFIALVLCAGAFSSCTHPVSPSPADAVTISGAKSGYTQLAYAFTASLNFTSQATLEYKWVFSDSTVISMADSIVWKFQDTGKNIFRVNIIQTGDNAVLCTALDTIVISDTIKHDTVISPNPNDTTSHNFTWTQFTNVNGENNMTGCWVFGANDIYACNQYLYHYDGNSWTRATLNGQAPGALSGFSIFGFNDNDFWIFAYDAVFHWNGTKVIETRLENTGVWIAQDGSIHSAWGTSSNDMYFVGDSGTILHFDGTNWTKMNSGTTNQLNSIWGTSDNNIRACGINSQNPNITILLHYDGTSWGVDPESSIPTSQSGGFLSVWACDSAVTHQVAWTSGTTIYHKADNGPWVRDSEALTLDLSGFFITGSAPNDLFAVGSGGDIIHWSGHTWNQYNQYYSPGDQALDTFL